jgi:DNA-binding SARP family transcriptional activator
MEAAVLHVKMLGGLTIRCGNREINDGYNRSRKVWLLLAYMIYCRNRSISQDELFGLLWSDEVGSTNPGNALKTMLHRVRSMLDQLGDGVGRTLIIRRDGCYAWNETIPFRFDVEEFETLCNAGSAAENEYVRLSKYLEALALYEGDFLPKLSSESWVIPVNAYFHNLYVKTARSAAELLEARGHQDEAISLCRRAAKIEPYDEVLYRHLMRDLLELDDQRGAIEVYRNMNNLLFSNFGVMPSDELRSLYREAVRTVNDREVSLSFIREQLKEPDAESGALFCDYDFFKVIYRAQARAVARSGDAVHLCLLTVSGENGELSKRSLDVCMENLRRIVCSHIRKGDVASRCSVSQYVVMLPQANYENACAVMERITRTFDRQYPHSPASVRYSVQPLEPHL